MERYTLGIDYGTLSGRLLILQVPTGKEIGSLEVPYAHGVMDTALPTGEPLAQDWALQHPRDWLDVLAAVPQLLAQTGIAPEQIVGIGSDFTACTLLPVDADGQPLCLDEAWAHNPNAWPKLWKHHGAQSQANRINALANKRNEAWLPLYGGKISSEWALPKMWQVLEEAPAIWDAADRFVEAGDWIVFSLCGRVIRNTCAAGYKGLWHEKRDAEGHILGTGWPEQDFLAALDPRLSDAFTIKSKGDLIAPGRKAGELSSAGASLTGLCEGTPVAAGIIDAHASLPAAGIGGTGQLMLIMGTSTCHIVLSETGTGVPGICGVVPEGVVPGLYAYEAGQACVGDHFAWFTRNCLPAAYTEEASRQGINLYSLLQQKAEKLTAGENGLLALDWWNGCRSPLQDANLSGMMVGMTLRTKPEEIYRALIEATAYGTRQILQAYLDGGVKIEGLVAGGGIARKDAMTMQIYADVLGLPIRVAASTQSGALGSAILGALAAGLYQDAAVAAKQLGHCLDTVYTPIAAHKDVYDTLYREYLKLQQYFGQGGSDVMQTLRKLRK